MSAKYLGDFAAASIGAAKSGLCSQSDALRLADCGVLDEGRAAQLGKLAAAKPQAAAVALRRAKDNHPVAQVRGREGV